MAGYTYTVNVGGRDFEIDSDQKLTDVQAYEHAKKQYDITEAAAVAERRKTAPSFGAEGFRQSAKETMKDAGPGARFMQGAGELFDRAAYGLKGLFTDLSPEERSRLQHNKVLSEEGGLPAMAGQVAGDLAITAPLSVFGASAIPAIARSTVGQTVGRMLPQALKTQGAQTIGGVGGAVAGGGATGAIMDPEDRVGGGLWGAGGSLLGGLPRAMRVYRGTTGQAGAVGNAVDDIVRQAGGGSRAQTATDLAARIEAGAADASRRNIPVTAAQAAGSPELAAKELGSRGSLAQEYAHFERQQNEAIFAEMERITRSGANVEALDAARTAVTKPLRDAAFEAAKEWQPVIGGVVSRYLDTVSAGATGASPSVQSVVSIVQRELTRPGGTNAARLYELQKWLNNKLSGPHAIGDDISAAIKGAEREVVGISKAIDAAIDAASGGKWAPYKEAYSTASRAVDDAVASREVREAAGSQSRQLRGSVPGQSGRSLASDTAKAGESRFGSRFAPDTERELNDLTEFVRRIEEPMRTLKYAGTGGGGSQTTMQATQVIANAIQMIPGIGQGIASPLFALVNSMRKADQEQLARLLLDPAAAVEALRRSAATGARLSPAEEAFRQMARSGARSEGQTGAGVEGGRVLVRTLGERQ